MSEVYDIFPQMILEHGDELRSGELHRGRFIGMYLEKCRAIEHDEDEMWLKHPQFVSKQSSDSQNNWLDYTLQLSDDEYHEFKRGLKLD